MSKPLSSHNTVGPTRSGVAGPLDYAKKGVGGSLPPTKTIEQINKATSPNKTGSASGTAKNPYDSRRLPNCWSPMPYEN